jgi:hypothetical protein
MASSPSSSLEDDLNSLFFSLLKNDMRGGSVEFPHHLIRISAGWKPRAAKIGFPKPLMPRPLSVAGVSLTFKVKLFLRLNVSHFKAKGSP